MEGKKQLLINSLVNTMTLVNNTKNKKNTYFTLVNMSNNGDKHF